MCIRRLMVWVEAARPKTLPAGIVPVVLGTVLAYDDGAFDWLVAMCALLGSVLIQIGANYTNDYVDFLKGADTSLRLGPRRVTQAGLVSPRAMRAATVLVFLLACVPGAFIVYRGGLPYVLIGGTAILFAVVYTAGPYPLGYLGIADLFVVVYFGPVAVLGTYYLQTFKVSQAPFWVGVSCGLLSTALLTVNNLRDIDQDRIANKRTLAVRFGATFARLEYVFCVLIACAIIPFCLALFLNRPYVFVAAFLSTAFGLISVRQVLKGAVGPELNEVLERTGRLLVLFCVTFAFCWLL